MNPKQQRFVDHYIETGSSIQAYRKAGYSSKTRNSEDVCAHQLLRATKDAISRRCKEIAEAGSIRLESKRLLLWEIAQKASGRILPTGTDEPFKPDYKAATAAINELNRMDGHHKDPKVRLKPAGFTFDAEILPPEEAEIVQENE